eukprot:s309_g2.t1
MGQDLEDAVVAPGACHSHTLVYLHAFGRCGKEYVQPMVDQLSPGFSVPWLGRDRCSGLRVVLPTAPKERQPWGPLETTWHQWLAMVGADVDVAIRLSQKFHAFPAPNMPAPILTEDQVEEAILAVQRQQEESLQCMALLREQHERWQDSVEQLLAQIRPEYTEVVADLTEEKAKALPTQSTPLPTQSTPLEKSLEKKPKMTMEVPEISQDAVLAIDSTMMEAFQFQEKGPLKRVIGEILSDAAAKKMSTAELSGWELYRHQVKKMVDSKWFEWAAGAIILLNMITIALETEVSLRSDDWVTMFTDLERGFLAIYTLDLVVRLIAGGWATLRDGWWLLDMILVVVGVVALVIAPTLGSIAQQDFGGMESLLIMRGLRLLRLVRALRMISYFKVMWRLVSSLLTAAGTMLSTSVLLLLALFISGVIAVELITKDSDLILDPTTGPIVEKHFSSLPTSILTLVQFVTLDSIAAVYFPHLGHGFGGCLFGPYSMPPGDLGEGGGWGYPGEWGRADPAPTPEYSAAASARGSGTGERDPPRSRSRRRRRGSRDRQRSHSEPLALMKVDGKLLAGASAAREEIARLIEDGHRSKEILAAIRSKETTSLSLSSLISGGETESPPKVREDRLMPKQSRKTLRPPSPMGSEKLTEKESERPVRSDNPNVSMGTFQFRKKAFPKPPEIPQKGREIREDSPLLSPTSPVDDGASPNGGSASVEKDVPKEIEPLVSTFKKKAAPPPPEDDRPVKPPRRPKLRVPNRKDPRTSDKYDLYDRVVLELFEELVILEVKMELVNLVYYDNQIDETRFNQLTDPRSPDTGLRYAHFCVDF